MHQDLLLSLFIPALCIHACICIYICEIAAAKFIVFFLTMVVPRALRVYPVQKNLVKVPEAQSKE